ncbi:MAG: D-alanine--D-alanine ligase [Gammaproteobacteria bacterium]|nr:D-alanine--D-alanine ligase [Gammaproteobacteria bacterium]
MKPLRILVLMHVDLVPPASLKGYTEKEIGEWRTEYDVVTTLREMGHEVHPLGLYDDMGVIRRAIEEWKPDIAFNLLEEFHGNSLFDHHVASYLELMQVPYTGCNPRGLMLAHDKALAKKILSFHRVRTPNFAVFARGRPIRVPKKLRFPMFIKSLVEEGSYGIAQASIVSGAEKLVERVAFLQNKLDTPVIAEEYIEGREFYMALIGNARVDALTVLELVFEKLPEDVPRIATRKVKWDWQYQKQYGIDVKPAKDLAVAESEALRKLGKRIYRLLDLSGYARIDVRVTTGGEIYVLEANANPDISLGGEMCIAAEAAGMKYPALLEKILRLGLGYDPQLRR